MANEMFARWRAELARPAGDETYLTERDDEARNICGFWRRVGARTKVDTPIAIWAGPDAPPDENGVIRTTQVVKVDTREPFLDGEAEKWDKFLAWGWKSCRAVSEADYRSALKTGVWPDGKAARAEETEAAKTAAATNAAPADESIADEITALAEKLNATPEPADQAQADALTGLTDRMRKLTQKADGLRTTEKEPFLEGGRSVDAKWKAIIVPGQTAYDGAEARRKSFLKKEQARLDAAADEARRAEQARVDAENKRIAEENAKRKAEYEAAVEKANVQEEPPAPPDLLLEAKPVEIEQPRAKAGSSFGVQRGLSKVKVAKVVDAKKLVDALLAKNDAGLLEYLQQRASAALRGKVLLDGVEESEDFR